MRCLFKEGRANTLSTFPLIDGRAVGVPTSSSSDCHRRRSLFFSRRSPVPDSAAVQQSSVAAINTSFAASETSNFLGVAVLIGSR